MDSVTERPAVVAVMRTHLQEIYQALDWAGGYFSAIDLAEGYRAGKAVPKPSYNTKLIDKAIGHVAGYLADAQAEDTQ